MGYIDNSDLGHRMYLSYQNNYKFAQIKLKLKNNVIGWAVGKGDFQRQQSPIGKVSKKLN